MQLGSKYASTSVNVVWPLLFPGSPTISLESEKKSKNISNLFQIHSKHLKKGSITRLLNLELDLVELWKP